MGDKSPPSRVARVLDSWLVEHHRQTSNVALEKVSAHPGDEGLAASRVNSSMINMSRQVSESSQTSTAVAPQVHDSVSIPRQLLSKLEGLPEALRKATDTLVKETVEAQARAQEITQRLEQDLERFERDRSMQLDSHKEVLDSHLDSHKEAFESIKGRIDALHEKWVAAHSDAMQPGVTELANINTTNGPLMPRQVTPGPEMSEERKAEVNKTLHKLRQGSVSFEHLDSQPTGGAFARKSSHVGELPTSRALTRSDTGDLRRSESDHTVNTEGTEATSRSSLRRMQLMGYGDLATKLAAPVRIPPSQKSSPLLKMVSGDAFNGVFSLVIIVNTIVLGVETNFTLTRTIQDPSIFDELSWAKAFNITLTCVFMVELLIRIAAERIYFFLGESRLWNLFDTAMVCTAIMDEIVANVGGNNMSFFRVIKILKMGRAVRIFRVFRFIRDLRVMVTSLVASLLSLAWAMLLLLILIYCSSVLLCQGVVEHFRENHVSEPDHRKFEEFYGSIGMTMYTHIMAISGGLDWYELVYPLNVVSRWHAGLFTFYVLFVVFGMLNVLTGVFVDRASELSHMDRDLVIESQKRKVQDMCVGLKKIFDEIDTARTGYIDWHAFKQYCHREDVLRYMAIMELNVEEARELFHMFDIDGSGKVNIDNFIAGCMRVKGHARSLDVLQIQEDMHKVKRMVMVIGEQLNSFVQLEEQMILE